MDIQEDISEREEMLDENLDIDTFGLNKLLDDIAGQWRKGEKSIRAHPVSNVLSTDTKVNNSLQTSLVGLDALINCLDDIIDTENLTDEEKITYTANVAFSIPQIMKGSNEVDESYQIFSNYWTDIFQIPVVEERLNKKIENSKSKQKAIEAALKSYEYRARDIDIFTRIGYQLTEPDLPKDQLIDDLRTYRARELLVKDIKDIERDKKDNDPTPIIKILDNENYRNSLIEEIYEKMSYESEQEYQEILEYMEPNLQEALGNSSYIQIKEKNL